MKPIRHSATLLAFLVIITSGCSGMFKGKAAAEKAVGEIHQLYNDEKMLEIRAAADSKFKSATSEKDWLDLMSAMHRKLGKVTGTSNIGFNVRSFNLTTTVVLQQKSNFEQGTGNETFTFEMSGDRAVLVGYNIVSKELIVK
jgi:hypothetical protein